MFGLSCSELLLYGGFAIMVVTALLTALCIVVFVFTGRKLKMRLEQEYGKEQF